MLIHFIIKALFKLHLDFLLNNLYKHIKINDLHKKRLNQEEFRNQLLNKYKKCIITNNDCIDELEACHIIEYKDGGNYDINLDQDFINYNPLIINCSHSTCG
jgi:hypothetical protein